MKRRIIATLFILLVAVTASGVMLSQYPEIKKSVDSLNEYDYSNNLVRTILAANYAIHYNMANAGQSGETSRTPSDVYIAPSESARESTSETQSDESKESQAAAKANAKYISGSLDTTVQQWDTTLKYNCQNLVYYAADTVTNQVQVSSNDVDSIPNGINLKTYAGKVGTVSKSSKDKDGTRYHYQWVITISYDNDGIASIKNQSSSKVKMTDYMYRTEQEIFLNENFPIFFSNDANDIYTSDVALTQQEVQQLRKDYRFNGIRNMTFVYAVPEKLIYNDDIANMLGYFDSGYYWSESAVYLLSILAAVIIIALLVPVKLLQSSTIAFEFSKIPLDLLAIFWILIPFFYLIAGIPEVMPLTYPDRAIHVFNTSNMFFPYAINFLYLFLLYASALLSVISFKKAWKLGWRKFFKHTFLYKVFHNLKQGVGKLFRYLDRIDLNDSSSARLVGIILANFFLLFIMIYLVPSSLGIFLACVYSLALMFIARSYITRVKENYRNLLQVTKNIANGDLDKEIKQDLGIFNSFKEDISSIRHSFKNAIEDEVKSQKMKTELISNVSHDLKTPLTTIITYTDLLKQEDISDEERQNYLITLERNEVRLKHLIEDLFEVSRVNNGDIQLNVQEVDIISLISQILVEHADKLQSQNLTIRTNYSDDKILMMLDPQKTYRVLVNIIINIGKYAMPGSRVYIDVTDYGEQVELSFKNMSATEITFDPSDIVDRFVRGDKSRNTEGSGLGLAISKSFTEIQGGSFHISVDGDLFKAVMRFPKTR